LIGKTRHLWRWFKEVQVSKDLKFDLAMAALMSAVMSFIFAGFFSFLHLGMTEHWMISWGKGFLIGWPLGVVIALVVDRPVRTLATRISGQ
tara:strand:- start:22 stop:294 length:273 start_codon:yes stop_codon:yes gene_type:complete